MEKMLKDIVEFVEQLDEGDDETRFEDIIAQGISLRLVGFEIDKEKFQVDTELYQGEAWLRNNRICYSYSYDLEFDSKSFSGTRAEIIDSLVNFVKNIKV